jgi:hypothetical protein
MKEDPSEAEEDPSEEEEDPRFIQGKNKEEAEEDNFQQPMTYRLIGLVNGSMTEADGMVEIVQVKVDKFTFLADMIVMKMTYYTECPLLLGRSFLSVAKALIDVELGETVLRSIVSS